MNGPDTFEQLHRTLEEMPDPPTPGRLQTGCYRKGTSGETKPYDYVAEDAVATLIRLVGQDPNSDGLKNTPARVVRALKEMTAGYREDPKEILSRTFAETSDEMIVVEGIEFTSVCEHHLLPFIGTADVGYIPGKVVGLSKLGRLVDCFARRLQIQERMTRQIAEAIWEHLGAKGVAVVVSARHLCMGCRGVRKPGARMRTSAMLGVFRDQPEARAEFLALTRGPRR